MYSPVDSSCEGENICIDESFEDAIMPNAIDSYELGLSKNAHENRAFSRVLLITDGDEMALPRKDEFSTDEIIVFSLNKTENITAKNNRTLRHDEYNIFFTFAGLSDFLESIYMLTFKYAMAENARMHMNMGGEFCNPRIITNMASMIIINRAAVRWNRITGRTRINFWASVDEVLKGMMGCFSVGRTVGFLRDSKGWLFWISLKPLCRMDRANGGRKVE